MVGELLNRLIALLGDHNRDSTPGPHLLNVRNDLRMQGFTAARGWHDDKHRLALLHQGDRAVLQLAGGKPLGVQVCDLLQLQSTLQGYREPDVAAQEQHGRGVLHAAAQLLDLVLIVDDLLDFLGNLPQLVEDLVHFVGKHIAAQLRQVQAQKIHGRNLGEECLRGGHGDFRAGMRIQAGVGLPRNGRTVSVADRNHLCALLPGVADRHERVHGFTRLGQGHHQGFLVHNGVPVPELVGQLHLGGDTAPVFDRIPGHHAGIGGRAAGNDNDLVDAAQHGLVDV